MCGADHYKHCIKHCAYGAVTSYYYSLIAKTLTRFDLYDSIRSLNVFPERLIDLRLASKLLGDMDLSFLYLIFLRGGGCVII